MDAIQKTYLMSKQRNVLPIITCGKYDVEEIAESVEGFQKIKDSDMVLDHDPYEKTIKDYIKNIQPENLTMEHYDNVNKIIQSHPEKLPKRILTANYLTLMHNIIAEPATHITKDNIFLSKDIIQSAIDNGFRAAAGRDFTSKYGNLKYGHDASTNTFKPVHHNENISSIYYGYADNNKHPYNMDRNIHKELIERHNEHITNHINSSDIYQYTVKSNHINKDLVEAHQENRPPKYESDTISSVIQTAPPHHRDFDVYSGLSKSANVLKETDNGTKETKFHAPSFMSTSVDFNTALYFAKPKVDAMREFHGEEKDDHEDSDILHITIPANFRGGAYVDGHSNAPGEREYLLDKGHNFTIHPNPKYIMAKGKFVRIWKATIHPKEQE